MTPTEVLTRLQDRFRLLTGARRGLARHQTLRHAIGWSYDLLRHDERLLLHQCAVFAEGFDIDALAAIADVDDYTVLDLVDSLVRKSLVTTTDVGGTTRYGMLETIRQFAEEQLETAGSAEDVRTRHARYFADGVRARWALWDGPHQQVAVHWVDRNFDNLRAAFRWAIDRGHLDSAAAIAAHTPMICVGLQRFEPVGWAEEILDVAVDADLPELPRIYTAASMCALIGRAEAGVGHAQRAQGAGSRCSL